MGRTRRETYGSICRALLTDMVRNRQGQNTSKQVWHRRDKRVIKGQTWSVSSEQCTTGQGKRVIQQSDDNPGEVQTESKRQDEREIQDRKKIRKQTIRQHDVTRLRLELETRNGNWLRKVAITRRAINAKQYSAIRKRKSMAYKVCLIGCSCVCNQCNGWWEM